MKNSTMSVTTDAGLVMFDFGELGGLVLDSAELAESIRATAMLHGLKQKCVDAAALSRNPLTGASASPMEKMAAVRDMIKRLRSGTWNDRTADSGGALLTALCLAYPARSRTDLAEWLKRKSDKERRALRASDKLKPFLAIVPDARGDELLGELS